jgi:hypothetical protein
MLSFLLAQIENSIARDNTTNPAETTQPEW